MTPVYAYIRVLVQPVRRKMQSWLYACKRIWHNVSQDLLDFSNSFGYTVPTATSLLLCY